MSKAFKYTVGIIVAGVILFQFFGPEEPANRTENPEDLITTEALDGELAGLLRSACYDCHSLETNYPWYAGINPVSGFIYEHIEEGREELNFSNWQSFSKREKLHKLKDIQEEVEEGKMPLESYTYLHSEAKLTDEQKELIVSWARELAKEVLKN